MIIDFFQLQSQNNAGVKTVTVFVQGDATGGADTVNFVIIDQEVSVPVNLGPNGNQTVTAHHTASGVGQVKVTAAGGGAAPLEKRLNVDLPMDSGSAVAGTD
jgi:hypothetical protein